MEETEIINIKKVLQNIARPLILLIRIVKNCKLSSVP